MITAGRVRYDEDVCAWSDRVSFLIREGKFEELDQDDLEHLAEEVEDVSKSEHRELRNRMAVLLSHLLKWQYQPERRPMSISGKSWLMTIKGQREAIDAALDDTPSLRTRFVDDAWIKRVWIDTLILVRKDTGMDSFPNSMPWTFEQVLNPEFLPD